MTDVADTENITINTITNDHHPEQYRNRLPEPISATSTDSPIASTALTTTGIPPRASEVDTAKLRPARPMSQPSMAISRAHSYHDIDLGDADNHPLYQQQRQHRPQYEEHRDGQGSLTAARARSTVDLSSRPRPPPIPQQQQQNLNPPYSSGRPLSTAVAMNDSDGPTTKRRAASISVDEANRNLQFQDLSLYTPGTARPGAFLGGGTGPVGGEPKDLICLCTKAPKVPRPRNAFILYRQHYQAQVAAQHPGLANPEISKLIGEQWREQSEEVKNSWKRLAEEEKVRHQRQYPDYRYQPRRGGKNGANSKLGGGAGSTSGEDPGRCQKCGGRFIATPRTPSTPFSAVTPAFAKTPTAAMPAYTAPNPSSRANEGDHLRRGSTASLMSVNSHGRRYTQPYLKDIDEDYPMISPTDPPAAKRQRFHGPNNGFMSPSPQPRAFMAPSEEPFYYHRAFMPSNTPMIASGFGPGPLPRPGISQVQQQQQTPPPLPPQQQQQQQQRQPPIYRQPSIISGMQPPPRPSVSYQGTTMAPAMQAGSGFDESLRLPPLQTQLTKSPPTVDSEANTSATAPMQNALGIMNPTGPPAQPRQHLTPQRPQFLYKLDVLRAISPPLNPPGPDAPPFETRGPIIAIEGLSPRALKEVTVVVEKALSISGECAVQIWADHEPVKDIACSESNSIDGKTEGDKEGNDGDEGSGVSSSPIARYLARMLKWHQMSGELTKYITHHPPPSQASQMFSDDGSATTAHAIATNTTTTTTAEADRVAPSQIPDAPVAPAPGGRPHRLPVAVVSAGYALTATERWAAALRVADAYRADDHWRWVATLWRGVVGADLTVYVRACGPDELRAAGCVEFTGPAVLVLRVLELPSAPGSSGMTAGGGIVDEKLERRLGFEIMEWVRSGQFGRGLV